MVSTSNSYSKYYSEHVSVLLDIGFKSTNIFLKTLHVYSFDIL